ncbi:MAG: hypothetical protein JG764_678 [Clostridiales bacterium]|nr:hypothetical protein [Clostridiales bacterium]
MFKKRWLYFAALVIFITIFLVGCGTTSTITQPRFESGVIDKDYRGEMNPEPPKELKLSKREQEEGIEKITIKCGVEIEAPGKKQNETEKNNISKDYIKTGGESNAKPKI